MDDLDYEYYGITDTTELISLLKDYDLSELLDVVDRLRYVATDNKKYEAESFLDNISSLIFNVMKGED